MGTPRATGGSTGPNTSQPEATSTSAIAAASSRASRPCCQRGCRTHNSSTGATTNAPPRSPSHQVSQMRGAASGEAKPAHTRLPTPRVALTAVPTRPAARPNCSTDCGRSNASTPPA